MGENSHPHERVIELSPKDRLKKQLFETWQLFEQRYWDTNQASVPEEIRGVFRDTINRITEHARKNQNFDYVKIMQAVFLELRQNNSSSSGNVVHFDFQTKQRSTVEDMIEALEVFESAYAQKRNQGKEGNVVLFSSKDS